MEHAVGKRYFVQRINRDCTLGWVRAFEPSVVPGFYVEFAVDRAGNSYLYSHFVTTSPADFDFTAGTDSRSAPFGDDLFITALGPAGEYRFTRTFGDTGYERPGGLTIDAAGDVYFSGIFQGNPDFDFVDGPEHRAVLHSGGSTTDAFFVAGLRGDGTFGWAHHTQSFLRRLAQGPPGYFSAMGGTAYNVDLDFGAGVDRSAPFCGGENCSHWFHAQISRDGDFKRAFYTPQYTRGFFNDVAYDATGRAYTAGVFVSQQADFDDGPAQHMERTYDIEPGLTDLFPYEPFVRRTDATGTFEWVHHPQALQSTGARATCSVTDLALGADNLYVGGYYAGALVDGETFDGTIASGFDPYIYSLDLDGHVRWGLGFEADDPVDTLYSELHLGLADDGRVTVVGQVKGSADLDLTDAAHRITGPTTFLVTFDPLECRERAHRACDCDGAMRGVQTCDADGHWQTCDACMPVTPPVACVPNCASPVPVCGAVANACISPLDCGPCATACTEPDGCALPSPVELAGGLDHPVTVRVDATDVYAFILGSTKTAWFAEPSPLPLPAEPERRILRMPKAGGAAQVLAASPSLRGLVQDLQYVYWFDATGLVRYNKAAGTQETWVTGLVPIALALEGNQLAVLGYVLPSGG
ncbi:MAG: hypothetical protein H0T79_07395, partial [Deltaproteobacteria bacterium]|nr:hypothetical protein [Deltaproteobacteria bacterium]